jgi:hypothetical protein
MLSNYGKVTLHNVELTLEDSEEFDINEDVN